jgi:hypothetical protein
VRYNERIFTFLGSVDLIVYSPNCVPGCNATATYDYTKSSSAMEVSCDDGDYYCNQQDCDYGDTCDWEDEYVINNLGYRNII